MVCTLGAGIQLLRVAAGLVTGGNTANNHKQMCPPPLPPPPVTSASLSQTRHSQFVYSQWKVSKIRVVQSFTTNVEMYKLAV